MRSEKGMSGHLDLFVVVYIDVCAVFLFFFFLCVYLLFLLRIPNHRDGAFASRERGDLFLYFCGVLDVLGGHD